MQSLILAAGYATRLYPLTKKNPKPLLEIGGKTIIDRLISDLDEIDEIDRHIIVTNAIFLERFEDWKVHSHYKKEIVIVNDGSTNNDNRLGAVRDILFVIEQLSICDDMLILAGDNIINFSFNNFVKFALLKGTSCITCHYEPSLSALQKTGVLETNDDLKVLAMYEKPKMPPSNWAVPPFYFYKAEDLKLISKALSEGCGFDAPGNLIAWLCKKTTVYAWKIEGKRYDIGDMESYKNVNKIFSL